MCSAGCRDHGCEPRFLDAHEFVRCDGLDFRHDQMRPLLLDQRAQRFRVGHIDHMGPMGDLLPRRVFVTVDRNRLDPQPLQFDDDFLAQLTRAEQHHFGGGGR
jgi:hypothetical protein